MINEWRMNTCGGTYTAMPFQDKKGKYKNQKIPAFWMYRWNSKKFKYDMRKPTNIEAYWKLNEAMCVLATAIK